MKEPFLVNADASETECFEKLTALARFLRSPQGCPWDREQGTREFAGFAREELQELLDALASGDNAHIEEEFGDVFFCLLAVAAAAEEEGRFALQGALRQILEKMIRRHDHVFGKAKAEKPQDAVDVWNQVKAREKAGGNSGTGY